MVSVADLHLRNRRMGRLFFLLAAFLPRTLADIMDSIPDEIKSQIDDELAAELSSESFDYSNPDYWEKRYKKQVGKSFEWYGVKWQILKRILEPHLQREHHILHVGTGNSELPEEMHSDGYLHQVGADVSKNVISQMSSKHQRLAPALSFQVDDALRSNFADGSFDVIIEKGTMEAVGSDRDCVLADEGCQMLVPEKMLLLEAFRLLRPGGILISVADELQSFPELDAKGLLRIERVNLTEKDGLPVPKVIFLCFKKAAEAQLPHNAGDGVRSHAAEL